MARRLTATMLGRMKGLVGIVDLDGCDLSGEGLDLRGVWMFQLLRVCFVTLAVARLLPAFSGFLLAFLRLYVWLWLVFGLVPLLFSWLQVDWLGELSSFLVLEAQD